MFDKHWRTSLSHFEYFSRGFTYGFIQSLKRLTRIYIEIQAVFNNFDKDFRINVQFSIHSTSIDILICTVFNHVAKDFFNLIRYFWRGFANEVVQLFNTYAKDLHIVTSVEWWPQHANAITYYAQKIQCYMFPFQIVQRNIIVI